MMKWWEVDKSAKEAEERKEGVGELRKEYRPFLSLLFLLRPI